MSDIVKNIIDRVRKEGDVAVSYFTKKYDGINLLSKNFKVENDEIISSVKNTDKDFLIAVKQAKKNIENFQRKILPRNTVIKKNGIILKHIFTPIEKVGIYVPGGKFSYPSTILMTAIPAKIAGVKKIVMVSPPKNLTNEVIATAKICGVDEIYRIGGVQAISALAYGTKTIPKVDKIVGPGNKFVTEAKRQVFGDVGIDMLAGPSEVLIIADSSSRPDFVVADLSAQCEHDKNAKAYLVSLSTKLSNSVFAQTRKHISKQLKIISVKNLEQAVKIANKIAPEHLEIITKKSEKTAEKIKNAGAIFIGNYSPVAVGDYFTGPSHVLPTNRTAKFSSGLSVYDFLKSLSVIQCEKSYLKKSANSITKLAKTEGFVKHAKSVKIRTLNHLGN